MTIEEFRKWLSERKNDALKNYSVFGNGFRNGYSLGENLAYSAVLRQLSEVEFPEEKTPLDTIGETVNECASSLEEIKAALSRVEKIVNGDNKQDEQKDVDGWISVKDRLPEKGRDVLFYCKSRYFEVYTYDVGRYNGKEIQSRLLGADYLYWQPLPEQPKNEE